MDGINESYWVGTDLKFAIEIKAEGFDMDDDDYEMMLRCGSKEVAVTKDDIVESDDGLKLLLIDTTQFTSGTIRLVVTARVPDDDFETGVRREVGVMDLCTIKLTY